MAKGWHRDSARHSLAARGMKTRCPRKSYDPGPEGRRYAQLEAGRDTRPLEPEPSEMYDTFWEEQVEERANHAMKKNPALSYEEALNLATEELEKIETIKKEIDKMHDEYDDAHYALEEAINEHRNVTPFNRKLHEISVRMDKKRDELYALGGVEE